MAFFPKRLFWGALVVALVSLYASVVIFPHDKFQPRAGTPTNCEDCVNFLTSTKSLELIGVLLDDGRVFEVLRNNNWQLDGKDTIVFLHGFPDNLYSFNFQMEYFQSQGFNVLSIPLRGYSPLSIPTDGNFGVAACAEDVVNVLDKLALTNQSIHVLGHDWGSTVAFVLAEMIPLRLKTLTAVSVPTPFRFGDAIIEKCPSQLLYSWYMLFFQLPQLPERWLSDCHGVTYLWNAWTPAVYSRERLASVCKTLAADGVTRAAVGWYRYNIPAMLQNIAKKPALPKIHVRTLAILGSADGCIRSETFKGAMRREDFTQDMEVVEMIGSGHFPHHDDPSHFNSIYYDFIHKQN